MKGKLVNESLDSFTRGGDPYEKLGVGLNNTKNILKHVERMIESIFNIKGSFSQNDYEIPEGVEMYNYDFEPHVPLATPNIYHLYYVASGDPGEEGLNLEEKEFPEGWSLQCEDAGGDYQFDHLDQTDFTELEKRLIELAKII